MDAAGDWIDLALDYADWAHEAGANAVRIHLNPEGPGTVGVELLDERPSRGLMLPIGLMLRVVDRCTKMAPANVRVLVYMAGLVGRDIDCDERCQEEMRFTWQTD